MKNIIFITCFTLVLVLITSCGSPGINGELTEIVQQTKIGEYQTQGMVKFLKEVS